MCDKNIVWELHSDIYLFRLLTLLPVTLVILIMGCSVIAVCIVYRTSDNNCGHSRHSLRHRHNRMLLIMQDGKSYDSQYYDVTPQSPRKQAKTAKAVVQASVSGMFCHLIVCPIHVHGFGQTKWSVDVRSYVRVCVSTCVHALDRIEASAFDNL